MTTQTKQPARLFDVDEYHAMTRAGVLPEDASHELIRGVVYVRAEGKPRLFDVDEYYAMAQAGILAHDERVELVNGEIIEMSPVGSRHFSSVNALDHLISAQLGDRALATVQNPLRIATHGEPEPDIMVLKWRDDFYLSGPPGAEDVLLLIEVSDSTLDYDLNTKLPLYAEAGIPETWIVNIPERVVEVYTEPVDGVYRRRRVFGQDESVSPTAFPEVSLPVSRIVPA